MKILESRLPFSYYFWIAINVGFTIFLLLHNNIINTIIYILIFGIFSYITICKYACKVTLYKGSILVKYYFPYIGKTEVKFTNNDVIRYELGYYYYFNSEHKLTPIQFLYPHDTIFFYKTISKSTLYDRLNVNTHYSDFKEICKQLERELSLIKSYNDEG